MTENLRQTVRSFLQCERPATPDEAAELVKDWFGRYHPAPGLLEEEVERHFAPPPTVKGDCPLF